MQGPLGVIGAVFPVLEKLGHAVTKYQDRSKAREEFLDALGDEIGAFNHFYDKIATMALGRFMPLLDSMATNLSYTTMNEAFDCLGDFYEDYASVLQCLIALAQRCKQVSVNPAFMDFLKETRQRMLYDFIVRMAGLVHDDSIKIDNEYYVFFKIYKREIFGKMDRAQIEKASKELGEKTKIYIKIVRRMLRAFKRKIPARAVLKRLIRNYKKLVKVSQKVDVRPTKVIDLADYMPSEMLPVFMVLDEAFPSQGLLTADMR
jgi:hypothetical protein